MMTQKLPIKSGFSLVELSIVLVITSLLIAVISSASGLVKQAKFRSVINEVQNLQTAVNTFTILYNALPGDYSNATTILSAAKEGDGNRRISFTANSATGTGSSETGTAFKHLELAKIVPGNFVTGNILEDIPDMAFPSKYKGGVYILTDYTLLNQDANGRNHISGKTTNVIRLGKAAEGETQTNTHVGLGLFTVEDAKRIDAKMDDGIAISGNVSGHGEYNNTTVEGCLQYTGAAVTDTDNEGTAVIASYNLKTSFLCNMSFEIHTALEDD